MAFLNGIKRDAAKISTWVIKMAKPFLASPARAASMVALRAVVGA
jgi:hypothetical protein